MKRKTIVGLIAVVAIATAVAFSGCIEEKKPVYTPTPTVTKIPQTTVIKIPQTTVIPATPREIYSFLYSRGDLLLIVDPADRAKETVYSGTIKVISGIDLEKEKLGKLIINSTWEDPTFPGPRYNYYLMYESSPGVWSKTIVQQGAPAKTFDTYNYTVIGHFSNLDIESIESIRTTKKR